MVIATSEVSAVVSPDRGVVAVGVRVCFGGWPRVPPLFFVGVLGICLLSCAVCLACGALGEKLCITSVVMFSRKLHAVRLLLRPSEASW